MSYISVASPFGTLTVFAEDDAIVAIEWGRGPQPPGKETLLLHTARRQLEDYFDGALRQFTLPLRPAGTTFQQRVWTRLAAIPYGTCATYGVLAHELGTGPRALAHACATNRLPILIPCHRVVGARGAMGGYSGGDGINTKRALLRLEGALAEAFPADADAASAGEDKQ
ncbi:MAG: methylated-DNA--[protein]-cysteine S-methyltransferase [Rhodospirillales bacterium]|nr:methylated-DNA--[protein]-cysteine S-methyltransferase [Rhodospirillales bacterium]